MNDKKWTVEHEDGHMIHVGSNGPSGLQTLLDGGYWRINLRDGNGWSMIDEILAEIRLGIRELPQHG